MYVCSLLNIKHLLNSLIICPLLVFTSLLGRPFCPISLFLHIAYTYIPYTCLYVCLSTSRSLATHRVTFLSEILQFANGVRHQSSKLVVVRVCVCLMRPQHQPCVRVSQMIAENNKDKTKMEMKMQHSRNLNK